MYSRWYLFCVAAMFVGLCATAQEDRPILPVAGEDAELEASADNYDFNRKTQVLEASGNVNIRYGELRLRADSVHVQAETGDVSADGGVRVQTADDRFVWQGEEASGNLKSKRFDFGASSGRLREWFYRVDSAERTSEGVLKLENVVFSTCDRVEQTGRSGHYSIRAKRAQSWPDGRYKAWSPTFRIGSVPFFWLPYVAGNANRAQGWHVTVGYEDDPGAFVFLEREFSIGEQGRTQTMIHWRQNNGLALGNDLYWDTDSSNTRLLVYGLHDEDEPGSETGPHAGFNQGFGRVDDRYRLRLEHRQQLTNQWELWAQLDWLSDVDMLEDFFEDEYDQTPNPASFLELRRTARDWTFALRMEGRVNEFDTAVQRLPQATVAVPRRPLALGFEYEGSASAGHYERKWRDYDENLVHALPNNYDTARADTLHMLYRPFRMGPLNVVPRLGGRVTWYGDSSDAPAGTDENLARMFEADDPLDPYDGPPPPPAPDALIPYDEDGGSVTRLAGEVGLELSTTFYRTRPNVRNQLLGLDGLRHVIQPYANYTYAPAPSEERDNLYFFDEIDRLTEQHFVRLGVRQQVQTRRDERVHELATLDTYADLHVEEGDADEHAGSAGLVASFRPSKSFAVDFNGLVDMDNGAVRLARLGGSFGTEDTLSVKVQYSYRDDTDARTYYSMGSTLTGPLSREWLFRDYERSEEVSAVASHPFNPRTRLTLGLDYDMVRQDSAETFVTLTRQLHCLMGSLTLSRDSDDDISLMLYFWIKAYPRFGASTSSG